MTDKTDLKREMRRNQLRNQARRKALAHVPLSNRRRYANILDQSNACYAVHETIRKEFDPTPKVIPPKE